MVISWKITTLNNSIQSFFWSAIIKCLGKAASICKKQDARLSTRAIEDGGSMLATTQEKLIDLLEKISSSHE